MLRKTNFVSLNAKRSEGGKGEGEGGGERKKT